MLLRNRLILLSLLFIVIFSTFATAEMCEVSHVRNNLRKMLYEYFESPHTASMELGKVKDLLNFYLSIPTDDIEAECGGIGTNSGVSYFIIVNEGDNITTAIPMCSDDTQFGTCSNTKPFYCYNGRLIDRCSECGCSVGECLGDGECREMNGTIENETLPEDNQTNVTSCTDTDGGKNYFTYGVVETDYGQFNDTCNLDEYYLEQEIYYVEEQYCYNGMRSYKSFNCYPDKCVNGRCNSTYRDVCYDDVCGETENCSICSWDCGICPPVCGDGTCKREDCNSCPDDCGICSFFEVTQLVMDSYVYLSDIFNNKIVYTEPLGKLSNLLLYDLSSNLKTELISNKIISSPKIYGDKIVYELSINTPTGVNRNVFVYDLTEKVDTQVSPSPDRQLGPEIFEDKIVWFNDRGVGGVWYEIYMYNLSSGQESRITNGGYERNPKIYGNKILFQSNGLSLHDLSINQTIQISSRGSEGEIHRENVVWVERESLYPDDLSGQIKLYNLNTHEKETIAAGRVGAPDIYENFVVWRDTTGFGYMATRGHVYLYDITTKEFFKVNNLSSQANYQTLPKIHGDKIIWGRGGGSYIYYTTLS